MKRSDCETLHIYYLSVGVCVCVCACVYGRDGGVEKAVLIPCVFIFLPVTHDMAREHFDEPNELFLSNFDCYHVVSDDFNAHTSILSDVVQGYKDIRIDLPSDTDVSDVLSAAGCSVTRANKDCTPVRSYYGKRLVEMYRNNNVVLFNGSIGDDMGIGKYTTTYNKSIDYVLCSCNVVKHIKNFKVLDFAPLFSDVHYGLQTVLDFSCVLRQTWIKSTEVWKIPSVRPEKWRNEKKEEYVDHVDVNSVYRLLDVVDNLSVKTSVNRTRFKDISTKK